MQKDPGKTPPKTAVTEMQTLEEQIRQRAYGLYEARGREDGRALDDWLQAESEILGMEQEAAA